MYLSFKITTQNTQIVIENWAHRIQDRMNHTNSTTSLDAFNVHFWLYVKRLHMLTLFGRTFNSHALISNKIIKKKQN